MRRFLLLCVVAFAVVLLVFGFSSFAPAAERVAPTPTADPLIWSGCKTCDVQQQRMQSSP